MNLFPNFASDPFRRGPIAWTVFYDGNYVGRVKADIWGVAIHKARTGRVQWKGSIDESDPPEAPGSPHRVQVVPF